MEEIDTMKKRWIKLYPQYFDKGLKHSEGRKISNELAVENPTSKELFFVCGELLKLDSKQELKHHPKDWMKRGRVIVGLKEDGKSLTSAVNNKNELMKFIGKALVSLREQTAKTKLEDVGGEGKKRRKKR